MCDAVATAISPLRCFDKKFREQWELEAWIVEQWPRARQIFGRTRQIHHSMPPWRSMVLAGVGTWFDFEGARILEIGGAQGGSAAIWAEAAPKAEILTLEPAPQHQKTLKENLKRYRNVTIRQTYSWQYYLETKDSPTMWDLVFVDGNHVLVHRDLPWWNRLKVGGLMLFDDYTPGIYPVVCAAVRDLWEYAGLEHADILVRRVERTGIAGVWKRRSLDIWSGLGTIE